MEKNENIHHSFHLLVEALHRGTLAGVPVAEAVAAHHHVVDGIVVLFPDLHPWVQEVISQRVQLDELDSQIRDLQEVCRGHQKKKNMFWSYLPDIVLNGRKPAVTSQTRFLRAD